jgi:hypothetical protein
MIEVLLRQGDSGELVNQVIASLNRIGLSEFQLRKILMNLSQPQSHFFNNNVD